jgi:hypothetical protein
MKIKYQTKVNMQMSDERTFSDGIMQQGRCSNNIEKLISASIADESLHVDTKSREE